MKVPEGNNMMLAEMCTRQLFATLAPLLAFSFQTCPNPLEPAQPLQHTTAEIWTLGHRNPLGLAFDKDGRLWNTEMGPLHGDEFNLVVKSRNYGYPIVSEGDHYSGDPIPDHETRPEFEAPKVAWVQQSHRPE